VKETINQEQIVLNIKDLVVEYRTYDGVVSALNGVDLKLMKGQALGLVGETGAGKTTTALSVLRLVPTPPGVIVSGQIELDDNDVFNLSEEQMDDIRGSLVSMIFQDPMTSLNPVMNVEDQIAEVIERHENVSKAKSIELARIMLESVGIPGKRGSEYPHQFSGGMKQRVVIAMALACNPKLIIADEPTTALDVTIQAQVLNLMRELRKMYSTSLLLITHDLGVVAEICDMVAVMYAGRIIEQGKIEDIFDHTKHPYTEGLFNSLPNLLDRKAKLKPIKGLMPDPSNLPSGCPFHPRCEYAMEKCALEKPEKIYRTESHYVECHLYNEQNIDGKVIKR
jgi:peptide/nickel transport system ATP-binding protein